MWGIDSRSIPAFVQARSPQGLRRQMLMVNARAGAFHKFFDIQFVNGNWIAWYYKQIENADVDSLTDPQPQKAGDQ